MNVGAMLSDLRSRGIELDLVDGRLVSRGTRGALTPELAGQIKERRDDIIAFLREAVGERDSSNIPPVRPVPRSRYMPASYSQERLWYLSHVDANPSIYNVPLSLRVVGPLRVDILQRCLDVIEERHEALRTTVEMVDGEPKQEIHPPAGLPMAHVDLRPAHAAPGAPTLDVLLQRVAMGSFDLARGPLARASLIRTQDEEHYFLLLMHHVVADGLSSQVILRDLAALYEAFLRGDPSPLAPLPVQFADYAAWQRGWLHGPALEQQLQYWRRSLEGELPVLDVPADFPRPPLRSGNGSKEPLRLGRDLVAALNRIGREEGSTPFMVMLALYKTLLHRHSGQDDLIIGAAVGNRTRSETADIVGFIANTVVLRTHLDGGPTFREVVRRVRDVCVGAFRHQDMPFQKIVELINPPRDLSRTPVFQAFFTFHEITSQISRMADVELHPVVAGSTVARQDLSLFLRELDGEVLGSLEYNSDLFTRETVRRMIGHFTTLAESAAANPGLPVARLPMLTDAERLALAAINATESDQPNLMVHELVSTQMLVDSQRTAVRDATRSLSYMELEARANRLAHRLRDIGVVEHDLVAVCVDRTVDLPASLLGVLKSGAAYVPLDPAYPAARLAYMLQDADVRTVVTQRAFADVLPIGDRKVVWLEDLESAPLRDVAPRSSATPDDVAYVIYTSGSSGLPKGVEVTRRNVVNFLSTMRERPGITANDVLVAVTTPSFDIAGLELYLPLTVGAAVVVAATDVTLDGARLAALLRESGATMMQATPATWRAMIDAGWQGNRGLKALCGGEALPPELARRLLPMVGELWNMYGPTETTIWSTCARVTDADAISIGSPVANTVIRVVDQWGQQLPFGVPGELLIGGAGVAKGYLGRAELTEERFVPDPTGLEPHRRLYRTGDLVKLRADGTLEHLGRLDNQVKVQGFRIELGEVEAVLTALPAVKEAVVAVHSDRDSGDTRLIAWVVYRPGEQPTVSEVRRYLRHRLPVYMVPGLIVQLDAIPRTQNGKVDRRALPNPLQVAESRRQFLEPTTQAQRMIADLWSELLSIPNVGRSDNFFELGGHSLLSMRVVAAVEQRTGIRLDPRLLFFQTVEQIAAAIEQRLAAVES